jgi:uncharacterized protein (TIGR02147 family)
MTAMASPLPDIYTYDDFRVFLKDAFAAKKEADAAYSYRKFAKDAGILNQGYLLDVVQGKRTLSSPMLVKMATAFGLSEGEREFLELLAAFGQSKKDDERQTIYGEILFRRNRSRFARLSPSLTKYYQDYRYPLVRCAIEASQYRGDAEALGKWLDPPLAPAVIKKIVVELEEWKLVRRNATGKYEVTSKFVEPPATMGAMVRRLNREWIVQAAEAPFRFPPAKRHVSTLLLMVGDGTRQKIQERVEAFRKEILDLVEQDKEPASVMQLSLQYFPRTNGTSGSKGSHGMSGKGGIKS